VSDNEWKNGRVFLRKDRRTIKKPKAVGEEITKRQRKVAADLTPGGGVKMMRKKERNKGTLCSKKRAYKGLIRRVECSSLMKMRGSHRAYSTKDVGGG